MKQCLLLLLVLPGFCLSAENSLSGSVEFDTGCLFGTTHEYVVKNDKQRCEVLLNLVWGMKSWGNLPVTPLRGSLVLRMNR
jgi:hypothetical protein